MANTFPSPKNFKGNRANKPKVIKKETEKVVLKDLSELEKLKEQFGDQDDILITPMPPTLDIPASADDHLAAPFMEDPVTPEQQISDFLLHRDNHEVLKLKVFTLGELVAGFKGGNPKEYLKKMGIATIIGSQTDKNGTKIVVRMGNNGPIR